MPVTGPSFARRTALAVGAGAVLAVAGCDARSGAPSGPATTAADPDAALVDRVVAALTVAERVAAAHGALEVAALHRTHLEALDAPAASDRPRAEPPRGDAGALRRAERDLHATLVAAAGAAASGALARLLASMSAAVAQRLSLPETAA